MLKLVEKFLEKRKAKKLDKALKGKRCLIKGLRVDGLEVVAKIEGVKYLRNKIRVITLWRYDIARYSRTYLLDEIKVLK